MRTHAVSMDLVDQQVIDRKFLRPPEDPTPRSRPARRASLWLTTMLIVLAFITFPAVPARAVTTYTVTTTADAPDSDPADGFCSARGVGCTLRAAIQQANTTTTRDRIAFRIPGPAPSTIRPAGGLPVVFHPIILDGYSQLGSRQNTLTTGTNAIIAIELDGSLSPEGNGLVLRADHSIVRGLAVNRFVG